jgi:hypothetical protein
MIMIPEKLPSLLEYVMEQVQSKRLRRRNTYAHTTSINECDKEVREKSRTKMVYEEGQKLQGA